MNSIQSLNRDLKKKINKSMEKLKRQMVDYEKYRDNYEYMKFSPVVQSVLQENNELKMVNAKLKEKLKKYKKMCKPLRTGLYDNITVKTEPGTIIDLTHENEPSPNIVYELIEEEAEEEEAEELEEEEAEEEEAEELEEAEAEEEEAEEEEAEEEEEEEEAEEEEGEEEEEEAEEEEGEEEEGEEEEGEELEEEVEEAEEEEAEELEEEEELEEAEELEEEEVEEEEVEEEEVYEVKIKNKKYYTTNETNGVIYSITQDGDIGDEVGNYVNGTPVFN